MHSPTRALHPLPPYRCLVWDFGSRNLKRGMPRAVWYGLEFLRCASLSPRAGAPCPIRADPAHQPHLLSAIFLPPVSIRSSEIVILLWLPATFRRWPPAAAGPHHRRHVACAGTPRSERGCASQTSRSRTGPTCAATMSRTTLTPSCSASGRPPRSALPPLNPPCLAAVPPPCCFAPSAAVPLLRFRNAVRMSVLLCAWPGGSSSAGSCGQRSAGRSSDPSAAVRLCRAGIAVAYMPRRS